MEQVFLYEDKDWPTLNYNANAALDPAAQKNRF